MIKENDNRLGVEIPGTLLSYSIGIGILSFIFLFFFAFKIKFSNKIKADFFFDDNFKSSTSIYAGINGFLNFNVAPLDTVLNGDTIAIIQTQSPFADLIELKETIANNDYLTFYKEVYIKSNLIQEDVKFLVSEYLENFINYDSQKLKNASSILLKQNIYNQTKEINNLINVSNDRLLLIDKIIALNDTNFQIVESLYQDSISTKTEIILNEKKNLIDSLRLKEELLNKMNLSLDEITTEMKILELDLVQKIDLNAKKQKLINSYNNLKTQVGVLIENRLTLSSASGIFYPLKWSQSNSQQVSEFQEIGYVVNLEQSNNPNYYEIILQVPLKKSGSIKIGNDVLLYPEDYERGEYGFLEAKISDIFYQSIDNKLYIKAKLSNGFKTSFGKSIFVRPQMKGPCDIIVARKSIYEMLVETINEISLS